MRSRLFVFFVGGGAVVLTVLFGGPYVYFVLFLGINVLTLREFYGLFTLRADLSTYGLWTSGGLYTLSFLTGQWIIDDAWQYFLPIFLLYPWVAWLFSRDEHSSADVPRIGIVWTGLHYITLPFLLLNDLLFDAAGQYNALLLLRLLLMVWSVDTFSYLVGIFWGKRALFPSISPRKTWEGSLGGGLGAVATTWLLSYGLEDALSLRLFWMAMALITAVAGIFGDLVASKIKRTLRIKDSGRQLGGHGGFLDRFDSFLISVPVWWVTERVLSHLGYTWWA